LPRIVTISDIRLEPENIKKDDKKKQQNKAFRLTMQAVIKTYRYMDENEEN